MCYSGLSLFWTKGLSSIIDYFNNIDKLLAAFYPLFKKWWFANKKALMKVADHCVTIKRSQLVPDCQSHDFKQWCKSQTIKSTKPSPPTCTQITLTLVLIFIVTFKTPTWNSLFRKTFSSTSQHFFWQIQNKSNLLLIVWRKRWLRISIQLGAILLCRIQWCAWTLTLRKHRTHMW